MWTEGPTEEPEKEQEISGGDKDRLLRRNKWKTGPLISTPFSLPPGTRLNRSSPLCSRQVKPYDFLARWNKVEMISVPSTLKYVRAFLHARVFRLGGSGHPGRLLCTEGCGGPRPASARGGHVMGGACVKKSLQSSPWWRVSVSRASSLPWDFCLFLCFNSNSHNKPV